MRRVLYACILLTGCKVGPNYKTPTAPVPPAYKEPPPDSYKESKDWKPGQPADGALRGKWWEMYQDPALNALEEQVNISNQNVLAAEAQLREARAAVRVARSGLFPTVSTGPSITAARGSAALGAGQVSAVSTAGGSSAIHTDYDLPFDLSYQADVWGSIRRAITAAASTAQASAAQLENARLSYQAQLAQDYFVLHGIDAEHQLLTRTVADYQEYLDLTRYQYQSGIISEADVALAQNQLESARAQLIDLGVERAQTEHAIAILTGKPPAEYTAPEVPLTSLPPVIPVGLPSELLERRPDVAAGERQVAAANEQIGIAKAAYFPTVAFSAAAGFESSSILNLLSWPSRFWSLGPQFAETLFDAGKRRGQVQETEAAYDVTVANYRQGVLTAFQQVEDNLAALRVLEQEATVEERAIQAAQRSLDVTTEQYKAGTATYLSVLTSQNAVLSEKIAAVSILSRRMTSSVLLIEALGGGWDRSQLPSYSDLRK